MKKRELMSYLVLFLVVFCYFQPIFSIEKQHLKENKKEFHFKLGADENSITEFIVEIPSKFSVSNDFSNEEIFGREFIQIGEQFGSWSEIITFQERIVYEANIREFIEDFIADYRNDTSKIECHPDIKKENNVPVAVLMVDTPSTLISIDDSMKVKKEKINGKNEIIGTKVVQGKFSLIAVQYTVRYTINTTSPKEKEAIKDRVLAFLNSCHIGHKNCLASSKKTG